MLLNKYRLLCATCDTHKTTEYLPAVPTHCPDNVAHTSISDIVILMTDGLEIPRAEDGKQYYTPDLFPLGNFAVHVGCGDDVANGVRGAGPLCVLSRNTEGSSSLEYQFIDVTLLAGGSLYRVAGEIGDYVDFSVIAPATVGAANAGAGAYDKYAVGGGLNMFIPNATTEGDWDLNLTESLNANVAFTKVVPVPAGGTGFFDYDVATNTCSLNPLQEGEYNLFDAALDLTWHVRKAPLLGEGKMCSTVAAVKPAKVLPHWKFKTTITHGGGSNALQVSWKLFMGRKITT